MRLNPYRNIYGEVFFIYTSSKKMISEEFIINTHYYNLISLFYIIIDNIIVNNNILNITTNVFPIYTHEIIYANITRKYYIYMGINVSRTA